MTPETTIQDRARDARRAAEARREDQVEELATALLRGEDVPADVDPDLVEDAAERAEERRQQAEKRDLRSRARQVADRVARDAKEAGGRLTEARGRLEDLTEELEAAEATVERLKAEGSRHVLAAEALHTLYGVAVSLPGGLSMRPHHDVRLGKLRSPSSKRELTRTLSTVAEELDGKARDLVAGDEARELWRERLRTRTREKERGRLVHQALRTADALLEGRLRGEVGGHHPGPVRDLLRRLHRTPSQEWPEDASELRSEVEAAVDEHLSDD